MTNNREYFGIETPENFEKYSKYSTTNLRKFAEEHSDMVVDAVEERLTKLFGPKPPEKVYRPVHPYSQWDQF